MKRIFLGLLLLCTSHTMFSQTLTWTVLEYDANARSRTKPLPFVNVFWLQTLSGTVTDDHGNFRLERTAADGNRLVVSFVGYSSDTIEIKPGDNNIRVVLSENITLEEVQIIQRQQGSYISRLGPSKTEVITIVGLCQLACCNLAESFENSATVDVGFADAVSGARQIQMLGLTGLHSQLMYENMPFFRGLSAPFGLLYVPGSYMESIQIAKGTASVINGFEALAGQINLEYRKPQTADPLFVNLYFNHELRAEVNVIANIPITERLNSTLFLHGTVFDNELDHIGHEGHGDGFMDMPKTKYTNLVYRWSYDSERYRNISTLMFLLDDRLGGQMGFNPKSNGYDQLHPVWGFTTRVNRAQAFTKNGFMIGENTNIGTQLSATYMDMKSMYGVRQYDAVEKNFYANMIYDHPLSERHRLNAGVSFQYNDIEEIETRDVRIYPTVKSSTIEHVPGVFSQYTYTDDRTSIVMGLRYDCNTLYKQSLITPRLHVKRDISEFGTIRGSIGKAYRSSMPIAENLSLMASSRAFHVHDRGLDDAWNYGINYVHNIPIDEDRLLTLSFDAYRTDFRNQMIVDLDRSAHEAHFYMSKEKSFANSFQLEAKADVLADHWVLTLAGRYTESKQTTMDGRLLDKPYVGRWKFLMVNNFKSNMNKWMLDITTQYKGKVRLPNTTTDGVAARPEYSEGFPMVYAQLTRRFRNFDVYGGVENIFNTVQHDPIINYENPFDRGFDATIIYGSLMMRTYYIGLRLTLGT